MDNKNPLVTIVVAVYNVEKYIERCIASILKQTYSNFKLLVVDDGSTDNSKFIIKKFHDSRITYIYQDNGGLSAARNTGIVLADTKYISFVDGDDYVEEDYLETFLKSIGSCEFVVANFYYAEIDGFRKKPGTILPAKKIISPKRYWKLFYKNLGTAWGVVAWNKLYLTSLLKNNLYKVGIIHEDEEIIHRLVDCANYVSIVDRCVYNYVLRPGSIMTDLNFKSELDRNFSLLSRTEYFFKKSYFKNAAKTLLLIKNSLSKLSDRDFTSLEKTGCVKKFNFCIDFLKKSRPILYIYFRYKNKLRKL